MLSGGSPLSWSETCAANTVTVHVSFCVKSAFGLIVKVVGPPVTTVSATLRVPVVVQTIWNQLPVTLTASLKVTVISVLFAWLVAPFVGVVAVTLGGASTLIVTCAVSFGVRPLVTVYVKVSAPAKAAGGLYRKLPSVFKVTVPPCEVAPPAIATAVGEGIPLSFVSTPGAPTLNGVSWAAE